MNWQLQTSPGAHLWPCMKSTCDPLKWCRLQRTCENINHTGGRLSSLTFAERQRKHSDITTADSGTCTPANFVHWCALEMWRHYRDRCILVRAIFKAHSKEMLRVQAWRCANSWQSYRAANVQCRCAPVDILAMQMWKVWFPCLTAGRQCFEEGRLSQSNSEKEILIRKSTN